MKSLKPFLFILLAAVLLGGGGIALYYYNTSQSPQVAPPVTTEKPEKTEVAKKEVPDTQLPEGFPINLPIESGAQITQNFTVTTPDGRTQSTRGYVSTKSLADSYKTFTDYLKKEGWIIIVLAVIIIILGVLVYLGYQEKNNLNAKVNQLELDKELKSTFSNSRRKKY